MPSLRRPRTACRARPSAGSRPRPRRRRPGVPAGPRGPARAATARARGRRGSRRRGRRPAPRPSRASAVQLGRLGAELGALLRRARARAAARSAAPARRPGGTAPAPARRGRRRRGVSTTIAVTSRRRATGVGGARRPAPPARPGRARGRSAARRDARGLRRSSCRAGRAPASPRHREMDGEGRSISSGRSGAGRARRHPAGEPDREVSSTPISATVADEPEPAHDGLRSRSFDTAAARSTPATTSASTVVTLACSSAPRGPLQTIIGTFAERCLLLARSRTTSGSSGKAGRASTATAGDRPPIRVAPPEDFPFGDAASWSPEHLFLASLSSCTLLAFLAHAANGEIDVDSYTADVSGTITRRKSDGRYAFVAKSCSRRGSWSARDRPTRPAR